MRRLGWVWAAVGAAFGLLGCSVAETPPPGTTFQSSSGAASVEVQTSPFALVVRDKDGNVLLESAPAQADGPYAPLAITHNTDLSTTPLITGWDYYKGEDGPWTHVSTVRSVHNDGATTTIGLDTGLADQPSMTVTITSDGIGVRIAAAMDPAADAGDQTINRVSMAFVLHDDDPNAPTPGVGDHFFGLGERFVGADQRGQSRYMWVEDRFGSEDSTQSPTPTALQANETYIPIPWMMDPRGFGMLQHTTFRTRYHLGDEASDAFRVEASEPKIDFSVFASADPKKLVQALTDVTGRAPEVPDWIFAPRRRADLPQTTLDAEIDKLRANHVPTTAIDTALHYLPSGIGTTDAKAATADIHARGFKAIAYFCPFVDITYSPVYDDAVANGYLVKHADGTPYVIFNIPRQEGIVDFTNPAAVTWYQGLLKQALDDGWDGWMYDFAEYVPQDAVMFNGMTGFEAHDLYPVLYQKAAHDLLEQLRPKDYLFFVRSGYAGTSGNVPMVWAGDEDTSFSLGKGLPSVLAAALNLGMSGVPFWGSDISGYHYLYCPPPDKELYLRWTEVGALSGEMHDENEGAGSEPVSARWQIWDDQESTDTYAKWARLHTQLVPYFRVAADEARATGVPIMRHLYLDYPKDPNVYALTDEYMLGPSLLAAPVVQQGAVTRTVYLPDAEYYDFFSGARVTGGGNVTVDAPLDDAPVFAKIGAIIPMLSPDVETLVPATDGSGVVSLADRADVLYLEIFAGNSTQIVLGDGTTIAQTAPAAAFDVQPPVAKNATLVQAALASDLATCDACWLDDPTSRTLSVTIKTQADTVTSGPLSVDLQASPNVKRFVMRMHH
ncbi:MAG TPA: TIM-barrel domain-containing protein [Polyangiaceae bacterium]|nr:TIM-barrel domain-containing protein [Polyangiaceae bacterium]